MGTDDPDLKRLISAITLADGPTALELLDRSPQLAEMVLHVGATRASAAEHYLAAINHYVYAGDTALHVAAAAHRPEIARRLIELGADIEARNRRGATPLHYAADGVPGSDAWNPVGQSQTVRCLIEAGANPNAADQGGVTPLHRAVRTRCAAAVQALLDGGADASCKNKSGSTPIMLARQQTGRGGSGSAEAKAQQAEIIQILER